MMQSKKGQFYLLAAILLSTFMFAAVSVDRDTDGASFDFEGLTDNFVSESPYVVNSAKFRGTDISNAYYAFVMDFIKYARGRNLGLGVMYVLTGVPGPGMMEIHNYLDTDAVVEVGGIRYELDDGENRTFNKTSAVKVTISENQYDFELGSQEHELKALFRNT